MNHPYIPHTDDERRSMLAQIGAESMEELFSTVPASIRAKAQSIANTYSALSEQEVLSSLTEMSELNATDQGYHSFLAGGCGRHHVPSAINYLTGRGEFLTSYTPYQPEVAQGNLQALFEFQTMVCELTGQDVANAGLYDGGTALVEAVLLAIRASKGRQVVFVAKSLPPRIREMLKTILCWQEGIELVELPWEGNTGRLDLRSLKESLELYQGRVACVCAGYPNYFGIVEDLGTISRTLGSSGALLISYTAEALVLGLVAGPGTLGAAVSVGDLQSFGVSPSFGGPWCGFMALRESLLRQMPGRLVGETRDNRGQRGFVLTLSTREQHIRRERATSNICTNNALLSLSVAIYLSLHGPAGLRELGQINLSRRVYLERMLQERGVKVLFSGPRFNEILVDLRACPKFGQKVHSASDVVDYLYNKGFLVGPTTTNDFRELPDCLLLSVTELNNRVSMDALAENLAECLC